MVWGETSGVQAISEMGCDDGVAEGVTYLGLEGEDSDSDADDGGHPEADQHDVCLVVTEIYRQKSLQTDSNPHGLSRQQPNPPKTKLRQYPVTYTNYSSSNCTISN